MVNKLLDEFNRQMRENNSLLDSNLRNRERLKRKLVDEVSREIHKDIRRRV